MRYSTAQADGCEVIRALRFLNPIDFLAWGEYLIPRQEEKS